MSPKSQASSRQQKLSTKRRSSGREKRSRHAGRLAASAVHQKSCRFLVNPRFARRGFAAGTTLLPFRGGPPPPPPANPAQGTPPPPPPPPPTPTPAPHMRRLHVELPVVFF